MIDPLIRQHFMYAAIAIERTGINSNQGGAFGYISCMSA